MQSCEGKQHNGLLERNRPWSWALLWYIRSKKPREVLVMLVITVMEEQWEEDEPLQGWFGVFHWCSGSERVRSGSGSFPRSFHRKSWFNNNLTYRFWLPGACSGPSWSKSRTNSNSVGVLTGFWHCWGGSLLVKGLSQATVSPHHCSWFFWVIVPAIPSCFVLSLVWLGGTFGWKFGEEDDSHLREEILQKPGAADQVSWQSREVRLCLSAAALFPLILGFSPESISWLYICF